MVIVLDSKNVWRREIFPNYKAGRKQVVKNQIMIGIIFLLYLIKSKMRSRLFEHKVIEVETAEADDIIDTLIKKVNRMIILNIKKSIDTIGDKDFIQLHSRNVKQYNGLSKFVGKGEDTSIYIKEHILKVIVAMVY